ncbi:hypothetical protein [Avibacterium paragallinarum]|uniref:hypothetical protein n=1 Tax=Avibacterium paragallinarum TaxID=728 RepID=UPI00021ACD6B|nr:hypothetical protein [Avibacterium paragallinarum]QJE13957.1 hypothetical protein HHJ60_04200 [Avibacterium paragallinarum]
MRVFCDPVFNALTRPIHRNGNNGGGNNCHCALHCCDFPNKKIMVLEIPKFSRLVKQKMNNIE